MSPKKCYKYCIVPGCSNTTVKTPEKIFISVPYNEEIRKKWCDAIRRNNKITPPLSNKTHRYCCEDHFNVSVRCFF